MFGWLMLTLIACGGSESDAPAASVAQTVEEAPPEPAPEPEPEPEAPKAEVPAQHTALFKPIEPAKVAMSEKDLLELGRTLYFETRLSLSQDISCNSCHQLDNFGVDNEPTSPGYKGQRGERNSPTVYNAFGHIAQFWDGRAKDVEEQALGPILNPVEMAMPDEKSVVKVLESIPAYHTLFAKAFPKEAAPITYANIGTAIGAFERKLTTPGRFDTYLKGDVEALTEDERAGLDTFIATGCATCHMGENLGGAMYQKIGLVEPYETEDVGRAKVTGNDADKFMFKVPSLRNIAKTGPYFHDGSVGTLTEAVKLMGKHQLGKELSDEDTASIITFLAALTGEPNKAYVAAPGLPPSGPETPGPQ